MAKLFLILFVLLDCALCMAQKPSINVDDLLNLSSLSPKNFDNYMNKKGFLPGGRSFHDDGVIVTFFEKKSSEEKDSVHISRSIDLYKKGDTWCFALHTSSPDEYLNGINRLKQAGFFYSNSKDTGLATAELFQKRNITVQTSSEVQDDNPVHTFLLQKTELPSRDNIRYAEDLLRFDSHEQLVSVFGENNVKKDFYFFSEKELKNCSVLFGNSNRQAVFIWDDENNLNKLSFIMISGVLPTANTIEYDGNISQNAWTLKNGIYSGMRVKNLLELNKNDFKFYGLDSEFSLMVEPVKTGNIDFKKIGIMLNCFNCNGPVLLNKQKVSAADAVDNSLALYVSYIMISH
jgi:hypothetical protein